MISLRQKVFTYLKNTPTADNKDLKEVFKTESWNSVRVYKNQYYKENKISNVISPKETKVGPSTPATFIDDPDELLYSVCIRELNKANPSPSWGNLLLSCREKIQKSKLERQSKLLQRPTDTLLSMIEKSYGKPSVEEPSPIPNTLEE